MVRFLLLPEDEWEFLEWAKAEHDLEAAAVTTTETGLSRIDPLSRLPDELPGAPGYEAGSSTPTAYVLRHADWGINDLDAWDTDSPKARIMRQINAEAAEKAGVSPDDLIDLERTRVIRFRRCGWVRDGELHVAALEGSARPARAQDPMVAKLLKSAERWLTRGSVRIELPADVRYRPRILARRKAHEWVLSGGRAYPWDG